MVGYEGVEDLVFKVISRIFSQADLDISVKLDEASAHTKTTDVYDLNLERTRADGIRVARTNLRRMMEAVKDNDVPQEGIGLTSLTCPALLRIQPFLDDVLINEENLFETAETEKHTEEEVKQQLHFLVWWADPKHHLSHVTCSQALPSWWRTCPTSNSSIDSSFTESMGGAGHQ